MTSIATSAVDDWILGFHDPADYGRARDVFTSAGYSEDGVRATLGISDTLDQPRFALPSWLRRTSGGTPRDTLSRLFFLGTDVDVDAATRAVHPMPLGVWVNARLLSLETGQARPLVTVSPFRGLLFAGDLRKRLRAGSGEDFVLPVSKSAALLARTMIDRPARTTLDLGTGCGIIGLLASAFSEHVVATDKNVRAVEFARFNARLNETAHVECLAGDLFEPVEGRRFDLMISNPPYVIAPAARYAFSDRGVRGDEFCRRLVHLAPRYLEDGGFCQVMGNWAHRSGGAWHEALAEWFEGTGCDVLVWGADTQDASSYATLWIQQTQPDHVSRFTELYDEWMDYYDREGIEAVTYGLITMRRSPGRRNWIRFVKVPAGAVAPTGEHILRRFAARDFLDVVADDRQLLDQRLRLAADVRLEQHYAPRDEGFGAVTTRLHVSGDPGCYSMDVDPTVSTLVMSYRGERRLRDVFVEMATTTGVDLERLVPGGLEVARRLVENGYLVPADPPEG